jgi:hypothetical protein
MNYTVPCPRFLWACCGFLAFPHAHDKRGHGTQCRFRNKIMYFLAGEIRRNHAWIIMYFQSDHNRQGMWVVGNVGCHLAGDIA